MIRHSCPSSPANWFQCIQNLHQSCPCPGQYYCMAHFLNENMSTLPLSIWKNLVKSKTIRNQDQDLPDWDLYISLSNVMTQHDDSHWGKVNIIVCSLHFKLALQACLLWLYILIPTTPHNQRFTSLSLLQKLLVHGGNEVQRQWASCLRVSTTVMINDSYLLPLQCWTMAIDNQTTNCKMLGSPGFRFLWILNNLERWRSSDIFPPQTVRLRVQILMFSFYIWNQKSGNRMI